MAENDRKGFGISVRMPANPSEDQRERSFKNACRKFKKMIQEDGILQTYRDRQEYRKPSERRNRDKAIQRNRWLKKQKKLLDDRGF